MFSEICTPLITRCLCAPLLYIRGACSLARSHQPHLWCGCHYVPKGTRPAAVSARSLIVKTAVNSLGEACRKAHWRPTCTWERFRAIHGSYPIESLALVRDSLRGAPMRTRGKFGRFSIPHKNTRVIDESLHISTLLFSFRIYIVCITLFYGRDSNTLVKL